MTVLKEAAQDMTLSLDAFIRSIGVRRTNPHSLFLGAGRQSAPASLQLRNAFGNGNAGSSLPTTMDLKINFLSFRSMAFGGEFSDGLIGRDAFRKKGRPTSMPSTFSSAFQS